MAGKRINGEGSTYQRASDGRQLGTMKPAEVTFADGAVQSAV